MGHSFKIEVACSECRTEGCFQWWEKKDGPVEESLPFVPEVPEFRVSGEENELDEIWNQRARGLEPKAGGR